MLTSHPIPRAAARLGLPALLLSLASCGAGSAEPVVVPWPHSLDGYDDVLVDVLEEARTQVRAAPGEASPWVRLGMLFEAHLQLELAESCYGAAVARDDGDARTWYRLAVMRGKNGDVEGALEAHGRLEGLDPSYGPAWRRKGWLLLGAGRPEAAAVAFARAVAVDPSDGVARLGLVETDLELGAPEAALERLDALGTVAPANQALAHRLRGQALARLGRFDEAQPELTRGRGARVGGVDPWNREVGALKVGESALLLRADRMIEGGQAAAALQLLRGLEERDPDDARVFTRKGRALARSGDWPGAAAALSRASELDPGDLGLALASASAMVNADDPAGALRAAERLVEIDPGLADAHALRVELLLGMSRAPEAAAAVAAARSSGVEEASIEVLGGKAALELQDPRAALEAFEAALALDPASTDALGGKAYAQLLMGRSEEAAASAAALRALDPEHPLLPMLVPAFDEAPTTGVDR